jgi:hypothetical protein
MENRMNNIITKTMAVLIVISMAACAHQPPKKAEQDPSQNIPKLKRPEVRRVWVPDQIVGDEYITGHWKYLIEKNSVWTKED